MRIILASGSPRRKDLLELIGLKFEIMVSDIEESSSETLASDIVMEIAKKKADAVAREIEEEAIIIGADTIVTYNGNIYGKPKNLDDARKMLELLQGENNRVFTGVTIINKKKNEKTGCFELEYDTFSSFADVFMNEMTKEDIEEYVNTKEVIDKAGSYAIQGMGARYIEKINGDYYTVIGLPINKIWNKIKIIEREKNDKNK